MTLNVVSRRAGRERGGITFRAPRGAIGWSAWAARAAAAVALIGAAAWAGPLASGTGPDLLAATSVTSTTSTTSTTMAPPPAPKFGYLLASRSGAVFAFGAVDVKSSLAKLGVKPRSPIFSSALTKDYHGYWLVDIYGGVYAIGDAKFYGSCRQRDSGCQELELPVVEIVPTPDQKGYWLMSLDGGVFSFGDAHYYGSAGQVNPALPPGGKNVAPFNALVVSMAATPTGTGYWLVTSDGEVASFGTAQSHGGIPPGALGKDVIVAIASTPDGQGYWLTSSSGHVYAFGDAEGFGDCTDAHSGCQKLNSEIGSMAPTPDGRGYWLFGTDGGVFAFGDAPFYGSILSPKHVGPRP